MKVHEDHSIFEASPSEQEVWRRSLAKQHTFEVGNHQQCNPKGSMCCQKAEGHENNIKQNLRAESKLQREAVAKADEAEEDPCQHQALRLGDQGAERAMATQDVADADYDARSGSEQSNSHEEKVDSSSGAADA